LRGGNGSTSSLVSGCWARCWSNHAESSSDSTGEDADANTKVSSVVVKVPVSAADLVTIVLSAEVYAVEPW
jgi:hypothetical protein